MKALLPRTIGSWATYGLCGAVVAYGVLAHAFGGLGLVLLLLLLVAATFLFQLVNLPSRWKSSRSRMLLPLLACMLVWPIIRTFGPYALMARFHWQRAKYEAVAQAVRSGTHPESIGERERALGPWVQLVRAGELDDGPTDLYPTAARRSPLLEPQQVVGVQFMTVAYGFNHHAGFMRAFDPAAAQRLDEGHGAAGWSYSEKVTDNWYLVRD